MQKHFLCTLRAYCTKSMVEWQPPPYLSTMKIYPTPGKGPIPPVFASNVHNVHPFNMEVDWPEI